MEVAARGDCPSRTSLACAGARVLFSTIRSDEPLGLLPQHGSPPALRERQERTRKKAPWKKTPSINEEEEAGRQANKEQGLHSASCCFMLCHEEEDESRDRFESHGRAEDEHDARRLIHAADLLPGCGARRANFHALRTGQLIQRRGRRLLQLERAGGRHVADGKALRGQVVGRRKMYEAS
ncbi:hypothetical protein T492DRAFT_1123644 [Pavlovales sp. CCMP2436]|nr:hypothetical protein T492DRAFT_1123644 [Pavlovales sp. CCMP2436]